MLRERKYYVFAQYFLATSAVLAIVAACSLIYFVGVKDSYLGVSLSITSVFFNAVAAALIRMRLNGRKFVAPESLHRGCLLDWFLPPNEVEHRLIELEEGRDHWIQKYGKDSGDWIFIWQSAMTVVLFWFDRIVVKVLAKKS